MTKTYELLDDRMLIADVDEKHHTATVSVYALDDLVREVNKTGHWIEEINDYGEVTCWHCDKCYEESGFTTNCKWDFCPNCGAKMIG